MYIRVSYGNGVINGTQNIDWIGIFNKVPRYVVARMRNQSRNQNIRYSEFTIQNLKIISMYVLNGWNKNTFSEEIVEINDDIIDLSGITNWQSIGPFSNISPPFDINKIFYLLN